MGSLSYFLHWVTFSQSGIVAIQFMVEENIINIFVSMHFRLLDYKVLLNSLSSVMCRFEQGGRFGYVAFNSGLWTGPHVQGYNPVPE